MADQLHLIQMLFHTPISHTMLAWADPEDRQFEGLSEIAYWQEIARIAERGRLDGIFFADTPAAHDQYRDSPMASVKHGVGWPSHDPLPAVAVMAAATRSLGFGATMSTTGTPPYIAVRRISTLDSLTGGRVGWNIVTGHLRAEHRAVGHEQLPHDERYDYADEYMEICRRLWDSVPAEAILADAERGVFADTDRIAIVDYRGKYLSCRAVGPALPSKQGRPVLIQAGSSGRGMQFAVRHAELVFAIQPDVAAMKRFMASLAAAAAEAGVPVPAVVFGVQPIVGGSEAEAQAKLERLRARIPLDAALSRMSGTIGIDLSKLDPDRPIEAMATQASQGMMAALTGGSKGATLREVALRAGVSAGIPQIVGTPEQLADRLEELWRETGCHGFNISPTTNPGNVTAFVTEIVPILQRRGIFRTEYRADTFRENLFH